jgi:hypothetical protein
MRFASVATVESRLIHNRLTKRERPDEGELVHWDRAKCEQAWFQYDSFPIQLCPM